MIKQNYTNIELNNNRLSIHRDNYPHIKIRGYMNIIE